MPLAEANRGADANGTLEILLAAAPPCASRGDASLRISMTGLGVSEARIAAPDAWGRDGEPEGLWMPSEWSRPDTMDRRIRWARHTGLHQ